MTGYFVHAIYKPKMDQRREKRTQDALKRCDAWGHTPPPMSASLGGNQVQLNFSNVDWTGYDDGTETELEIFIDDPARAQRLAAELRCCGMSAAVSQEATARSA